MESCPWVEFKIQWYIRVGMRPQGLQGTLLVLLVLIQEVCMGVAWGKVLPSYHHVGCQLGDNK
jgi:hypothetical protein